MEVCQFLTFQPHHVLLVCRWSLLVVTEVNTSYMIYSCPTFIFWTLKMSSADLQCLSQPQQLFAEKKCTKNNFMLPEDKHLSATDVFLSGDSNKYRAKRKVNFGFKSYLCVTANSSYNTSSVGMVVDSLFPI